MDISLVHLIPPMIIFMITVLTIGYLYYFIFGKILPKKLFNSLRGLVALVAIYVWAVPLKAGFYEFFRATL